MKGNAEKVEGEEEWEGEKERNGEARKGKETGERKYTERRRNGAKMEKTTRRGKIRGEKGAKK